jgi:hypothetical protein
MKWEDNRKDAQFRLAACEQEKLEKVVVWYSIRDGGDGSAHLWWCLTEERAKYDQEHMDPTWGEDCMGSVETFIGSDVHKEAVENEKEVVENENY